MQYCWIFWYHRTYIQNTRATHLHRSTCTCHLLVYVYILHAVVWRSNNERDGAFGVPWNRAFIHTFAAVQFHTWCPSSYIIKKTYAILYTYNRKRSNIVRHTSRESPSRAPFPSPLSSCVQCVCECVLFIPLTFVYGSAPRTRLSNVCCSVDRCAQLLSADMCSPCNIMWLHAMWARTEWVAPNGKHALCHTHTLLTITHT